MIEITHRQAQRMIREAQDRPLPDEQWAILQAHLEVCAECCAYRARLGSYDRDLYHSLRTRWGGVHGPRQRIDLQVLKILTTRKERRRFAVRSIPWVLGGLALFLFIAYRTLTAPEPLPPPPPTPTLLFGYFPAQTATPALPKLNFHDLTVFESRRDGNAEIYLLNVSPKGPVLTNMTQNPAQDKFPAWSPDGEWIAFLSDRTGKNEVYVMHVAGSRLTQITNDPQIDWQGPLEWSYDGKYIGLSGQRIGPNVMTARTGASAAMANNWLYLVPLDGSKPLSLASSYGAKSWLRFSSTQPGVAFASVRTQHPLNVTNTLNGWTGDVTLVDSQNYGLQPILEGAFDWSLGGHNLVYVVNGPPAANPAAGQVEKAHSEVRLSQEIEVLDHINFNSVNGAASQMVDRVDDPNRFRAVSWMPHSLVVASLAGNDAENCWTIHLINAYNKTDQARILNGLCVIGGLTSANWTADGNWLVLLARKPEETTPSLYALRLPNLATREDTMRDNTLANDNSVIEKLVELKDEAVSGSDIAEPVPPYWVEPHVRPTGRLLNIVPKAAPETAPALDTGATFPLANTPGWLVYSVLDGQATQIVRVRPDGTQRMVLTGSPQEHSCPRLSPDGKTIAYLSASEGMRAGVNEIFSMDVDGKHVRMLTNTPFAVTDKNVPFPRYDCPVWSPDGKRISAVLRGQNQNYLALIPADGKSTPEYLQVEPVSALSAPVWIPKNAKNPALGADQILLIYPQGVKPTRLVAVDVSQAVKSTAVTKTQPPAGTPIPTLTPTADGADQVRVEEKIQFAGWDDVQGLTLSPDGKNLVGVLEYMNDARNLNRRGQSAAQLRVFRVGNFGEFGAVSLENFDSQIAGLGALYWLPDGTVGLTRVVRLIGEGKTVFERFDPATSSLDTLARFEDKAYRAVLSNGQWVIFSAESGLWALDLKTAQSGRASPGLLSDEQAFDLDWH